VTESTGRVGRNGAWRKTVRRSSNTARGQPDARSPTMSAPEPSDPVSAGAEAAGLLEEACRSTPEAAGSLQLAVVRGLALDIERELDALARSAGEDAAAPDLLTEAALLCADLANLAACNVPELPPDAAPRAAAAARLAAGAVRTLRPLIETGSGNLDREHAANLLRDVRGAAWRAEFAARLVDGESSS
jgi:hypothetical protein